MTRAADVDRQDVAQALDRSLRGFGTLNALPMPVRAGPLRSYIIETNERDAEGALRRAEALAFELGGSLITTKDAAMALVEHADGAMVVDVVDPRFWLVHVPGTSAWADELVSTAIRRSIDLDWAWLPTAHLDRIQDAGRTRWFKSDFSADELLGDQTSGARRLKVQLEGQDADKLRRIIAELPDYRGANSLTGLAVEIETSDGYVREAAHYRGSFKVAGDSFDLHQAFLASVATRYGEAVRRVERDAAMGWEAGDSGFQLSGAVIQIRLATPIERPLAFAEHLLGAKDPFRLWGVPTPVADDYAEAEVVDLHIGKVFRLDILTDSLRIYLDDGVCGNTVFRLLANLQHRYDATASAWIRGTQLA